jgi:hypothetical protein
LFSWSRSRGSGWLRLVAGLLILFLATTGKQQACQGEGENRGGHSVEFHNGTHDATFDASALKIVRKTGA